MKNVYKENLISIIMPAYNSEMYIEESIQSVINQTYYFWELLIINDCSKDDTAKIAEHYALEDKRIKVISLSSNFGVARARNEGIKIAQGRYIAFLDSDDIWLPTKLERQLKFMREKQIPMSFTQYRQFSNTVENVGSLIDVESKISYKKLLKGNVIGCLTTMIDRKIISDIYMPTERHEDYITWLAILKQGIYAYGLEEDLGRYRKNINSLSGNKFKSLSWTWNVYRKNQKLSLIKSSYYFCHYVLQGLKKHF